MSFANVLRRLSIPMRTQIIFRSYATEPASSSSSTPTTKPGKKNVSDSSPQTIKPRSSCPANTILTGANYLKGQPPVVAMEDDAYPEWLWDTLKPKVYEDDGPGGKKDRVERRRAIQQAIKDRNFMQTQ